MNVFFGDKTNFENKKKYTAEKTCKHSGICNELKLVQK